MNSDIMQDMEMDVNGEKIGDVRSQNLAVKRKKRGDGRIFRSSKMKFFKIETLHLKQSRSSGEKRWKREGINIEYSCRLCGSRTE